MRLRGLVEHELWKRMDIPTGASYMEALDLLAKEFTSMTNPFIRHQNFLKATRSQGETHLAVIIFIMLVILTHKLPRGPFICHIPATSCLCHLMTDTAS